LYKISNTILFKVATISGICNANIKCDSSLGLKCVDGICKCSSPFSWTNNTKISRGGGTCLNSCINGYTIENSICGNKIIILFKKKTFPV